MPNHIMNEIIFRGVDANKRREIIANVRGKNDIDFETLLPSPLNIWPGDVGSLHEARFPSTHLDWARANWGTKWNAYGLNREGRYRSISGTEGSLMLRFQTAWSPPMGWIVALFNRFKLSFEHNWLDEGRARGVCGRFNYAALASHGTAWQERDADDDMQAHLHTMLWGVASFDDEAA